MKIFNKYKIHLKSCTRLEIFPYKIRLFKRTKWNRFKHKNRRRVFFKIYQKKNYRVSRQFHKRTLKRIKRYFKTRKAVFFNEISIPNIHSSFFYTFFPKEKNSRYHNKKAAVLISKEFIRTETKKLRQQQQGKLFFKRETPRPETFFFRRFRAVIKQKVKKFQTLRKLKIKIKFNKSLAIRRLKRQIHFHKYSIASRLEKALFKQLRFKQERAEKRIRESRHAIYRHLRYVFKCFKLHIYNRKFFKDLKFYVDIEKYRKYQSTKLDYLYTLANHQKSAITIGNSFKYENYKKTKIFRNFKHNKKIKFQFKKQKFFNKANYFLFKKLLIKSDSFKFNRLKNCNLVYKNFFFIYSKFYNIFKYKKHIKVGFKTRHYRKKRLKFLSYFHYNQRKFLYFNKKLIDLKYSKTIYSLAHFLKSYKEFSKLKTFKRLLIPFKIEDIKRRYGFIKNKIPSSIKLLKFYNLLSSEHLSGGKYSFLRFFPSLIQTNAKRRKIYFKTLKHFEENFYNTLYNYKNLCKTALKKNPRLRIDFLNYPYFLGQTIKKKIIPKGQELFKKKYLNKILKIKKFKSRFILFKKQLVSLKEFKRSLKVRKLFRKTYRIKIRKTINRIRYRKKVRFITMHKIALKSKYNMVKYSNAAFNFKMIKKDIRALRLYTRFNFLKYILVKQLYKIDILLWRLKICESTAAARQLIFSKQVLINDNYIKPTYFVKKGDVIKFFPYRLKFILTHPKRIKKKKKTQ